MALAHLKIDQFRCIEHAELALDRDYNLFIGPNGSGKTSLLEAIFFLGRGRSFRTRRLERIIRLGQTDFRVVGRVQRPERGAVVLGIRGSRAGTEVQVGGAAAASAAELAVHFSPQVIDPEVHRLLEDGPARRRRFLDWGVFHVEPTFLRAWQRYHRALRQRNAALRSAGSAGPAAAWDAELASAGEQLTALRAGYVERLQPELTAMGRQLLDATVTVGLQRGWTQNETLVDALRRNRERDLRLQQTQPGPQRADLSVRVDEVPALERVSRGQQKLLAAALTLAQLRLQQTNGPGRAALLLDDPAAELDAANLERLVGALRSLDVQLVVTALNGHPNALGRPGRTFHVERGAIRPAD